MHEDELYLLVLYYGYKLSSAAPKSNINNAGVNFNFSTQRYGVRQSSTDSKHIA